MWQKEDKSSLGEPTHTSGYEMSKCRSTAGKQYYNNKKIVSKRHARKYPDSTYMYLTKGLSLRSLSLRVLLSQTLVFAPNFRFPLHSFGTLVHVHVERSGMEPFISCKWHHLFLIHISRRVCWQLVSFSIRQIKSFFNVNYSFYYCSKQWMLS